MKVWQINRVLSQLPTPCICLLLVCSGANLSAFADSRQSALPAAENLETAIVELRKSALPANMVIAYEGFRQPIPVAFGLWKSKPAEADNTAADPDAEQQKQPGAAPAQNAAAPPAAPIQPAVSAPAPSAVSTPPVVSSPATESVQSPPATEVATPSARDSASGPGQPAPPSAPATDRPAVEVRAAVDMPPHMVPDPALISVLRDLVRALKDSPEVVKLENACQKNAAGLAEAAIVKALENIDAPTNRIVHDADKSTLASSMTVESWDSGDIELSANCHASLSAVWAKKINGLINLAVAGNCADPQLSDGGHLGEFVFILNGKSSLETGFDIQSQSDVSFWLGKINSLSIDTACSTSPAEASPQASVEPKGISQKATIILKSVLTERSRKYMAAVAARQEQQQAMAVAAACHQAAEMVPAQSATTATVLATNPQTAKAEEKADQSKADLSAPVAPPSVPNAAENAPVVKQQNANAQPIPESNTGHSALAAKQQNVNAQPIAGSETSDNAASAKQQDFNAQPIAGAGGSDNAAPVKQQNPNTEPIPVPNTGDNAAQTNRQISNAQPVGDAAGSNVFGNEPEVFNEVNNAADGSRNVAPTEEVLPGHYSAPAAGSSLAIGTPPQIPVMTAFPADASPLIAKQPDSTAALILPDKAVAGKLMTLAVLNAKHGGNPAVELSLNGKTILTGDDGKLLFMVPDDSRPGPSLQVTMSAHPEQPPVSVQILQPLAISSTPGIPKVDTVSRVVPMSGTIIIDGHNFEGMASHNRVIVDGVHDARVLVSSPVQIKADLPVELSPGAHSISVSTADLRSNPGQFEAVEIQIKPDPHEAIRDVMTRLNVRVVGTQRAVQIHLANQSPDVLKLLRGNDMVLTTPGGPNNVVTIGVQRFRKANYRIKSEIE